MLPLKFTITIGWYEIIWFIDSQVSDLHITSRSKFWAVLVSINFVMKITINMNYLLFWLLDIKCMFLQVFLNKIFTSLSSVREWYRPFSHKTFFSLNDFHNNCPKFFFFTLLVNQPVCIHELLKKNIFAKKKIWVLLKKFLLHASTDNRIKFEIAA